MNQKIYNEFINYKFKIETINDEYGCNNVLVYPCNNLCSDGFTYFNHIPTLVLIHTRFRYITAFIILPNQNNTFISFKIFNDISLKYGMSTYKNHTNILPQLKIQYNIPIETIELLREELFNYIKSSYIKSLRNWGDGAFLTNEFIGNETFLVQEFYEKSIIEFQNKFLDHEIINIFKTSILVNYSHYVEYNSFIHYNETSEKYRKQAFNSYPGLYKIFNMLSDQNKGMINNRIFEGLNVVNDLCLLYKTSKEPIKFLLLTNSDILNEILSSQLVNILQILTNIPKEKYPKNEYEWNIFNILFLTSLKFNTKRIFIDNYIPDLVKNTQNGISGIEKRLEKNDITINDIVNMEDFFVFIEKYILSKDIDPNVIFEKFLSFGVIKISKLSKRWHDWIYNFTDTSNEKSNINRKVEWMDLFVEPYFQTSFGYFVIPLTSKVKLEEEGKYLKHCVGGYSRQCLIHNCFIYSIRSNIDIPSSTVEIQYDFFSKSHKVIQHQALENTKPNNMDVLALTEFRARKLPYVNEDRLDVILQEKKSNERIQNILNGNRLTNNEIETFELNFPEMIL